MIKISEEIETLLILKGTTIPSNSVQVHVPSLLPHRYSDENHAI